MSLSAAVSQQSSISAIARAVGRLRLARDRLPSLQCPLTLTEKVIFSHLDQTSLNAEALPIERGQTYLKLKPDRVAMQDASAQMALLQFMQSGRQSTAVPSSIHCDHLITAQSGEGQDLSRSLVNDSEVYHMLDSFSRKYGIAFWSPGSGIIHQIVLENYAFPGGLMLGTDSHTPNAGGLGMLAIGVGGADAVDAMADIPWELKCPRVLGVKLTGKLNGWASPKDVILYLAGKLTVRGGTGYVLEYFGDGVESLSCTGMATICNMGAEVGATSSIFPYESGMKRYLRATVRQSIADIADQSSEFLQADPGARYDKTIEINLSTLEPHVNGPFTPDASTPISKLKQMATENGWPTKISASLIGSCTNSSYQDLSLARFVIDHALKNGLKMKSDFFVSPGSERVRSAIERDGHAESFLKAGGKLLANACGPCIGQWDRTDDSKDNQNVILTSFNRNFRSRNDGNPLTMNFLASPQLVAAMAFAGDLCFNPLTDTIKAPDGSLFRFEPPKAEDLPSVGFPSGRSNFAVSELQEPNGNQQVIIDPQSKRLQLLEPFDPWNGKELEDLKMLVKVKGKCTTDHISAAGPWLRFKGHLENISENTLIGAVNAANSKVNLIKNELTQDYDSIPSVAKQYKVAGKPWFIIAEHNYGEGSAREHAALQPRFLGCSMILAKSFARIHETNLKKQGILPLTFVNPEDYDRIPNEGCSVDTVGLIDLISGRSMGKLKISVRPNNGQWPFEIPVKHTMSREQCHWFKYGSALNMIRLSKQQ